MTLEKPYDISFTFMLRAVNGATFEVRGAGLGAERPMVGTLEAGMVLSVTTTADSHRWRDLVLVADEPRPLLGGAAVAGDG